MHFIEQLALAQRDAPLLAALSHPKLQARVFEEVNINIISKYSLLLNYNLWYVRLYSLRPSTFDPFAAYSVVAHTAFSTTFGGDENIFILRILTKIGVHVFACAQYSGMHTVREPEFDMRQESISSYLIIIFKPEKTARGCFR